MAIVEFRRRFTGRFEFNTSLTWENSTGTKDNGACGILGLCSNGHDNNPNYELNPFFTEGSNSQEVEWQFKIRGSYQLPAGFNIGADLRWYSGRPWGATTPCYLIPGCNDPFYGYVMVEPKDAQKRAGGTLFNMRLGKDFAIGGTTLAVLVDVLNIFNEQNDVNTNIWERTDNIYPRESAERGEPVSATGLPASLARGREIRLGLRFMF